MKKGPTKNKKVTTDDLAVMVAKGFDGVRKEIGELNVRLGSIEDGLSNVKDDTKAIRQDILNLGNRFVPRHEFYDLATRVSLLEQKKKVKR
ncbi:MAG: hypothetical protein HZB10_00300 [Candidatus Yonathbacteria bacterium]|nr:hypothetical protein [Candidatus Yonathbacteria bacterium]